MKAKLLILLGLFIITNYGYSQVGINTTDIDFSAILQVESTNKGVLFPSLTLVQRDALDTAAANNGEVVPPGLTLYCSDCCTNGTGSLFYHNGADWKSLDSDCNEIGSFPECVSGTTNILSNNHLGNSEIQYLFDDVLTENAQGNTAANTDDLRLHQDGGPGNGGVVEFDLGQTLSAGAKIVLYWSDIKWPNNLGLLVDLDNGGTMSQASIDTLSNVLPNSTNTSNGSDDFILTITLIADTDTITVRSFEDGDGDDPILLEFKILDDNDNEISFNCN